MNPIPKDFRQPNHKKPAQMNISIEKDLLREFKIYAVTQGKSMNQLIIKGIRKILKENENAE